MKNSLVDHDLKIFNIVNASCKLNGMTSAAFESVLLGEVGIRIFELASHHRDRRVNHRLMHHSLLRSLVQRICLSSASRS